VDCSRVRNCVDPGGVQVGLGLGAGYGTYFVVLPAIDASTAKIVKVRQGFR
jgi:hypothetical protein